MLQGRGLDWSGGLLGGLMSVGAGKRAEDQEENREESRLIMGRKRIKHAQIQRCESDHGLGFLLVAQIRIDKTYVS